MWCGIMLLAIFSSSSPAPGEVIRFPIAIIRSLIQIHAASHSTNGPGGRLSLSLTILPDSPTCRSEGFTDLVTNLHISTHRHPPRNHISSLPLPPFALVA